MPRSNGATRTWDPAITITGSTPLERLCAEKGLLSSAEVERRKEQWRQAYLHTPHGQPIELSAAGEADQTTR